jgi:hypothetical protein
MSLLSRLREKQASRIATVTPATFATQAKVRSQTVATVTVTDQRNLKTDSQHESDSTRSKVVAHEQSSPISLEFKALRDQEVNIHNSGTSVSTVPADATVATFATKLFDQEQRIYPSQRVATVTVATLATDVETSCAACAYVTKFGNCSMPVRAGLSSTFMLISHPEHGAGCDSYEPRLSPLAQEALALASIALREGAISEEEHSQATQSIHEHADYIHEWIQLIAACQESKSRRSER